MVASGSLNVGLLMNVLFAIILGSLAISQLLPLIETFSKAIGASQKIIQTINRIPLIDSLSPHGEVLKELKGNVQFENVSFSYPTRPEGTSRTRVSLMSSRCVERSFSFHSCWEIHCDCWGFRIRQVDNHSIN